MDECTKLCLCSLTQKFIKSWVFVKRKKESMKTESPALARQRDITYHEEKEDRERPWIFLLVLFCSFNKPFYWFLLHRCTSGVRPLFGAHPKMGTTAFDYLHIVLANVHCSFYFVTSPTQLTFNPVSSLYIRLVAEGGAYLFPVVPRQCRRLGTPRIFYSQLKHRSPLPVTGWPLTSGLAWLTWISWLSHL